MKNSRSEAEFIVYAWLQTKDFPANLLKDGADRAFVQDLVYTTIRRLRPLRSVLGKLVRKWPKGELEAFLYIGAAQLLYMPDVPDYAAVYETVEAAKEKCPNANVAKVVNGVLQNIIRRRGEFEKMIAEASVDERESFPSGLYRRWVARFGAEKAEALAKWHNEPAETYLAYPDRFEKLERGMKVTEVEGFAAGAFIVQDPATALAVEALEVKPGDEVLDACAAPGGKTVQLAWRGAKVTACEVNPKRRRRLVDTLNRVGVEVKVVDSLLPQGGKPFSKILVDAPCSNSGVLRRRPDARWNWSEEKLSALVRLQAGILDQAAALLAPGGLLVYSTCSNEPDENHMQVEAFLKRHPEFSLKGERESVPFETGHDGAFAAVLKKGQI